PSSAGFQPMPASWVSPKMSPLGAWRSRSSVSGRLPAGPAALVCPSCRGGSGSTREAKVAGGIGSISGPGARTYWAGATRQGDDTLAIIAGATESGRQIAGHLGLTDNDRPFCYQDQGPGNRSGRVMQLLDLTLDTPVANLALDEALLLEAEAGAVGAVLRFW